MKRALIITVAGTSSRFRKSIGQDVLKCIYTEKSYKETLLYRLLDYSKNIDKIVIVGGYKFKELKDFIELNLKDFSDKLDVIENTRYEDLGSGYSLYLGIKALENFAFEQVIFAEGDLFLDEQSFKNIIESETDVITTNLDPIEAKKAVAFYTTEKKNIKYIYDTQHSSLLIDEPFLGIYNSGQVWKFIDKQRLDSINSSLTQEEYYGTNLVIIQKYFGPLNCENIKIIQFNQWINCNTVIDYRKMLEENK